ncbi:ABC transporter ATP-binding protein [Hymenobacter metallilatus]|uniref:ATP-binding cassette domain-containing protein n=1 Tax=Hymenobacter metallilatus TaxID=2493666 RepID=A0A428IY80_9BACT|nr:ATP-binding cassette domain-containing protein [Hymenobacter metallilatus]RSK24074.1 ATP-binding cassette domain-containing protein [Hymenobacter metallilatus]
MAQNPPALEARHLTRRYGTQPAVQDVSFALAPGETLVLLGPSGCGKTTLLRMLNRLVEPDAGTVLVHGQDVRQVPVERLRRGIGYVIQQVGLLPHYTVAENVAIVPRLLGQTDAWIARRTDELLTRLHLPPARFGGQYPHQLSGGQQQRVGLARALAADPPIVLLDEPFGALDPLTRTSIRREFRELPELRQKTMVLVTHDVQEAFELADRILLLDHGRVQQLGTPAELLFRPATAFVREFFAADFLSLQLRVLRLQDILSYLPLEENETPVNAYNSESTTISPTATIQDALQQFNPSFTATPPAPPQPVVWVRGLNPAHPDEPAPLTYPALMGAFARAAQQLQTA